MPKFTVAQGPLAHDDQLLEDGAEVELTEAQAKPLLEGGVIEVKGKKPKPEPALEA